MRHIQRVDFTYNKQPNWLTKAFMWGCITGLAIVAFMFFREQQLLSSINAEQKHVVLAAEFQKAPPKKPLLPEQVQAMQEIKRQFQYPWQHVFLTLENVTTPNVRLISLDPDIATGKLKLVAEAVDKYEMYNYVNAINNQEGIQNVDLIGHKNVEKHNELRLGFELDILLKTSYAF